jgi:hypothetical protein
LRYDTPDFLPDMEFIIMQASSARRASIILGAFMAVVLIAGAILPLIQQDASTTQTIEPTDVPVPTFPPPITDFSTISFDLNYLHPTGLYTIAQPTGFDVTEPNSTLTIAQVNMVDQTALSVIDAYVEDPGGPITPEELDARFDAATLAQSWSRFNNWEELSRRMEDDALLIDFEVELQDQTYVARQKVWTDGDWIYVVRVLAPDNATDFLVYMLDNLANSLQPFKMFVGTPFDWQAYYDNLLNHIIRYPSGWTVTDSAPGRTASITGTNGEALRVEAQPNTTVADEDAARAWVENQRSGATILSVEPVTRDAASGFSVAYAFTSVDGAPQSGLAVLLNGSDDTLHIANLLFPAENVDLNTIETTETTTEAEMTPEATAEATVEPVDLTAQLYSNLALSMSTFWLMPPLNLSPASLPPVTPTPLPTAAPVEATAEVTSEATGEPEATAEASTDEPDEAGTETPDEDSATAEVTSEPTVRNLERFSGTATALAESRLTPTAAP